MSDSLALPVPGAEPPADPAAAALTPVAPITPIRKEPGEVDPARAANVKRLVERARAWKKHFEPDFKRMCWAQDFAAGKQYEGQDSFDDDRYRLNLVLRHLTLRVAALYAKHPKAVYKRKPKLDFAVWDGRPETLMMAQQQVMMAQQQAAMMGHNGGPAMDPAMPAPPVMPPPDAAIRLLQDYEEGMAVRGQAERLGRTLEVLWDWFITEPVPNVKVQMKAMVRRAATCGVGYIKLGYQRKMGRRPDQTTRIADLTMQLQVIERLRAKVMGDDADRAQEYEAEAEELRLALKALESQPEVVLREGPLLDFPRATAIIPDPRTRSLRGWIGTSGLFEEFQLPASTVEQIYGVRIPAGSSDAEREKDMLRVMAGGPVGEHTVTFWQYYDLSTKQVLTIADGWKDYLEEPRAPEAEVEQFFPYYAYVPNEIEHEKRLFPPSDVELLRSPQDEYNRQRESLRQHRIANRPVYVTTVGAFEKQDVENLSAYDAHDVIALNNLKEGQSARELLQPLEKIPIDPNVYEVEGLFSDVQRATGSQEANIGGTAGATATETSVAESSRMSGLASNTDDLDELLTDLARDFSQVCLLNMEPDFVVSIVGRGAVWPEMSRSEIVAEGALEVEAGSSGRPNRAQDLANFERAAPYLLQIPGIDPEKMAEYGLRLLDDRLDVKDFLKPGLPSIIAMNSMSKPGPADPGNTPEQQGGEGGQNAPAAQQTPGGPQPAYGPSGNAVG